MTTKVKKRTQHSHLFREFLKEAYDAGMNDTVTDDELSSNALHFIEQEIESEKGITDNQRDLLIKKYILGFKRGL